MPGYIFINGKLVLENKACISVNDSGFLYGDGLFETIRGYNGYIFMLTSHLKRLFSSTSSLKFNIDFDDRYIEKALKNTLEKNKLSGSDAYIKLIVTRGIYKEKLDFKSSFNPSLIIITKMLIPYPEEYYKNGIKIISSSIKRSFHNNRIYRHKLLNYFENVFAKNEALSKNAQEAIFLTPNHLVLEGSTSNIFYVKKGTVFTPPLTQNILPGITREIITKICNQNNIKLKQKKSYYYDIIEADEVFITNSIAEVMPVRKIDGHNIGDGVCGSCTKEIMKLYKEKVNFGRENYIIS